MTVGSLDDDREAQRIKPRADSAACVLGRLPLKRSVTRRSTPPAMRGSGSHTLQRAPRAGGSHKALSLVCEENDGSCSAHNGGKTLSNIIARQAVLNFFANRRSEGVRLVKASSALWLGARGRRARLYVRRRGRLRSSSRYSVWLARRAPARRKVDPSLRQTTSSPSVASVRPELAKDDRLRRHHAVEEAGSVGAPRVTRAARGHATGSITRSIVR